ncbi:MAG TPA: hypothetical protein VL306_00230 [Methylomirabilota bacterium]|jgi:uncharacterized membrane protein|nr:hypothetical protein [Methylomirabilota bacterium]
MDTNNQAPMPPPSSGPNAGSNKTLMGILSYLGILVVIPLITDAKNDQFVKFHIKQGLVLLICDVLANFIVRIPVFGWILSPLIWLGILVLAIMGIINVVNNQTKELPVIGHLASMFNF